MREPPRLIPLYTEHTQLSIVLVVSSPPLLRQKVLLIDVKVPTLGGCLHHFVYIQFTPFSVYSYVELTTYRADG